MSFTYLPPGLLLVLILVLNTSSNMKLLDVFCCLKIVIFWMTGWEGSHQEAIVHYLYTRWVFWTIMGSVQWLALSHEDCIDTAKAAFLWSCHTEHWKQNKQFGNLGSIKMEILMKICFVHYWELSHLLLCAPESPWDSELSNPAEDPGSPAANHLESP